MFRPPQWPRVYHYGCPDGYGPIHVGHHRVHHVHRHVVHHHIGPDHVVHRNIVHHVNRLYRLCSDHFSGHLVDPNPFLSFVFPMNHLKN